MKTNPILPHAEDWPLVQHCAQQGAFAQSVLDASVKALQADAPTPEATQTLLRKTAEMELSRVQHHPWPVDLPDEKPFWESVLADCQTLEAADLSEKRSQIVQRYTQEIAGGFRIAHYRWGQWAVGHALARLLLPSPLYSLCRFGQRPPRLADHIRLVGAVEPLRQLAQIGTVIIVPTHFSHIDSALLAWVTHHLGLPHFTYGAGLNLFNHQPLAYFLNRLGTYKIDRRKKNAIYLTTLKTYVRLLLQQGCHSVFYPGGTRSRSGALEQQLKLGLLGTALEAQRDSYQAQGRAARKLFVVPVAFSYHFVLEAPGLISHYLTAQQNISVPRTKKVRSSLYPYLQFLYQSWTQTSSCYVSIGQAMDLLGHTVDEAGHSYDAHGTYVDTYTQYLQQDAHLTAAQQHEARTRALGHAIVAAYYKINCILTSHLVAFVAFELIQQQCAECSLQALLALPAETIVLPYADLARAFTCVHAVVLQRHRAGQVQIEEVLQAESISPMIQHGLANLGLYHAQRPLQQNCAGDITTQDLSTLFYYHNRLQGYDLEQYL